MDHSATDLKISAIMAGSSLLIATGHAQVGPQHAFARQAGFPHWTLGISEPGVRTDKRIGSITSHTTDHLTLTAPDTPYSLQIQHKHSFHTYWAFFTMPRRWRSWTRWPNIAPEQVWSVACTPAVCAALCTLFRRMHDCAVGGGLRGDERAINLLEEIILSADEHQAEANRNKECDPRIVTAIRFIEANYNRQLSIEDIAAFVGLSSSRFAHLFRDQAGTTPRQYIDHLRIKEAQRLLLGTTEAIAHIGKHVGYEDAFHFSTRFRQLVGVSPSAFRRHPSGPN